MRSGRAFPSTPIAGYAAQRARASLLLEASVAAPYRQKLQSAGLDRPRATSPHGLVLQPYAAQRARASLVLEALVSPPATRTQIRARTPAAHRRGTVNEPRPILVTPAAPPVTPPSVRTQLQAHAARQQRHGAVIAPRPVLVGVAAPVVTPPRTTLLVGQERQARTRSHTIATSYPSALAAASLALEALVSPPSVRTLIEARAAPQHRRGVVLSPRPVLIGVAAPVVTPPRTQTIVLAQARGTHRPHPLVLATGAPRTAPVAAPLPTIITVERRRPVAHGHVTAQRPVLLPGQLRPQPRVVAPLPQRRRRIGGRVLAPVTRVTGAAPFVPITSPSQGVFSDNPQTGLSDAPSAAPFSDQAQTGLGDSPRSGGWDKHL